MRVLLDEKKGTAFIGNREISIRKSPSSNNVQINGPKGTILRPIAFGKRTESVHKALIENHPKEWLAAKILETATVQAGLGERTILEILALKLAGAEKPDFSFAETLRKAAESQRTDSNSINNSMAREIDALVRKITRTDKETEWRRIVLVEQSADDLDFIRDQMTGFLLERAVADNQETELEKKPAQLVQMQKTISAFGKPAGKEIQKDFDQLKSVLNEVQSDPTLSPKEGAASSQRPSTRPVLFSIENKVKKPFTKRSKSGSKKFIHQMTFDRLKGLGRKIVNSHEGYELKTIGPSNPDEDVLILKKLQDQMTSSNKASTLSETFDFLNKPGKSTAAFTNLRPALQAEEVNNPGNTEGKLKTSSVNEPDLSIKQNNIHQQINETADLLAIMLNIEADLRGIDR